MSDMTPDQKRAAEAIKDCIAQRGTMALRGFAGTGKTYTLGHSLPSGADVLLLAPTHKALAQAQERLPQCHGSTTASALGMRLRRRDGVESMVQVREHRIRGYDAVIVDEASMVDTRTYQMITEACASQGCALIWVGDPAQLPPVGEDESPVFARVQHQAVLSQIIRQDEGNPIIDASLYVRGCLERGERPTLAALGEYAGGVMGIQRAPNQAAIAHSVLDAVQRGMDCRGIAYTNRAVSLTARYVVDALHPDGSLPFVEGDQIVMGRPHDQGRVKNNEEGIVIRAWESDGELWVRAEMVRAGAVNMRVPYDSGAHHAEIKKAENQRNALARKIKYTSDPQQAHLLRARQQDVVAELAALKDEYADVRYTYSSTAHKSQGSTLDAAVIDWPDLNKVTDTATFCRMLYVAITRPSEYLLIIDY